MKLVIVIEGDLKTLFSIAITLRCREVTTAFPGLLHLLLICIKQGDIK